MDAADRRRRRVTSRSRRDLAADRFPGLMLAALVAFVQLAWVGVLLYLGFRFL
jgi:hypothetical protein